MPDMPTNLDAKAAAALERAKQQANVPQEEDTTPRVSVQAPDDAQKVFPVPDVGGAPIQSIAEQHQEDSDVIPPPPTAEEIAKQGGATADEVVQSMTEAESEEDDAVILSGSKETTKPLTEEDETIILTGIANERLGNVEKSDRESFLSGILPEIAQYKKKLIIEGFTPAEATEAAENRMKRSANEFAENWAKEHPEGVVITIDKSQEDSVKFTEEEEQKLQKAKLIKLVAVETRELETLKVKNFDRSNVKMSHIRNICDSISRYSIPLLAKGDYAYFNGAQSGVLVNATTGEDDDLLDALEKKASLLYRCFGGSVTKNRIDEKGKEISYEDFCNWYKYDDIDMGIYAIVTASTMEESESTYICQNRECNRSFNITYNNKMLLDLSGLSDEYKARLKEIDEHRSSFEYISKLVENCDAHDRFRSPFSNTIFELANPSIAEVRNKLDKCMQQLDNTTALDLILFIYVGKIWVHDPSDDSYMMIDANEDPEAAFDVLCHLHQVDFEIVSKMLQSKQYSPSFKIHVKCPHCGRDATDDLGIDAMIFLHARASLTEIQ